MSAADARPPRRPLYLSILACAALLVLVTVWLVRADPLALRDRLRGVQFWVLEAQAILVAGLTIYQAPHLVRLVRASWTHYACVAAASILAVALTAGMAPRTSRIYYDEQIYQSVAQNMRDLRLAQLCNEGSIVNGRLRCASGFYNKQPYGYPYLIALGYRIAGVHESVAFTINNLTAALTVWVVFFAAAVWFERASSGVYAALVAALIPIQILWSNTAASEPTASLAAASAVLAAAVFLRTKTHLALWWTMALAIFAAQFRPESIAILPLVAIAILTHAPREVARPRLWWAATAGVLLLAPLAAHMVAVSGERWGTSSDRVSIAYVASNLRSNGGFYLWDPRFPFVYTVFALTGVIAAGRRALVPVLYFAAFFSIFLLFYAGSYDFGADVRYSVMTYPPLAMLAGAGLAAIDTEFSRVLRSSIVAATIVTGLAVLPFVWYVPLVRAVGEEAWGARADVAFARDVARTLPRDAIVLTHDPNMFQVWGVSAAQIAIATSDPAYVRDTLFREFPGGVYAHWGFWCNAIDPEQNAFCTGVLDAFPHTPIRDARARDFRFVFYRLR